MNPEKITDAMEHIGDDMIEAADEIRRRKRGSKKPWIKWCAAACVLLAVGGFALWRADHRWPVKVEIVESTQDSSEIYMIPHWEDMAIYEQYGEVELNGARYTARRGTIPAELTGKKLADVTARGWDEYMNGEGGERYISAQLFAIGGISTECAVAVKYEGSEECYAALNSWYRPDTLGQFIDDLDLREHLVVNCAYYEYRKPVSGQYASVRFDGVDSAKVWELLLSHPDAVNVYDEANLHQQPDRILGLSIDIPLFGYENISLSVAEGGYIKTNILDTGKLFFIGEEYTQAFVDYILNECEGYEIVHIDTGTPIPE